jgi:hypothetical protein
MRSSEFALLVPRSVWWSFAFIVGILILAACISTQPISSPLPTVLPEPTPLPYKGYTTTLGLPDGRILPVECVTERYAMGETRCQATFPNGNVMEDVDLHDFDHSPDNRFAFRKCVRTTHDASCLNGSEVWNIMAGIRLRSFAPYAWFKWVPGQQHTAAYIEHIGEEKLVLWNLVTDEKEFPTTCPEWLIVDEINLYDSAFAVRLCKKRTSPTAILK